LAAHPVPVTVHVNPSSATAGGTQVVGIANDEVAFEELANVRHLGGGLESDNWVTVRSTAEAPAKLIIPVRDVSALTLQLLLALLGTGSNVHSHGGNSTAIHGDAPGVALGLRPKDTGQKYLYGPNWKLHRDSRARIVWSRNRMLYDGSELILAPHRSTDGTKKAYMHDSAAAINAHYFA
jgi:hypothetical protein